MHRQRVAGARNLGPEPPCVKAEGVVPAGLTASLHSHSEGRHRRSLRPPTLWLQLDDLAAFLVGLGQGLAHRLDAQGHIDALGHAVTRMSECRSNLDAMCRPARSATWRPEVRRRSWMVTSWTSASVRILFHARFRVHPVLLGVAAGDQPGAQAPQLPQEGNGALTEGHHLGTARLGRRDPPGAAEPYTAAISRRSGCSRGSTPEGEDALGGHDPGAPAVDEAG